MKLSYLHRIAASLAIFCLLTSASCEQQVETVTEVTLRSTVLGGTSGNQFVGVRCSGDWTLTLSDNGKSVDWASLSSTSGSGNLNSIILSWQANDSGSERSFNILLDDGQKIVKKTVTQKASSAGTDNPGPAPDPSDGTELSKTGWLELPALDNPALGYYSHSFTMSGKSYRNYSFGWSQKDLVALWVAYPLCKFYTNGDAGRTNAWAYDPLLDELSAAPFSGYAEELARGHQLPSADRQCSVNANEQTFYGTNMTPQLNAHNEGIWSDLEQKVRNIANNSDTTYVVTGVVVEGSKRTTTDSDGKKITVPAAYFKALLRYSRSSTLGQWNAAAFYLEHRAYSENISQKHSMSIDELEEITGIDFFANLPAKVGEAEAARLEAADPADSALWW